MELSPEQRGRIVASLLAEHYPQPEIPLQYSDPYTLLVAVMLSARCTDKRVNQITPALFAQFPDVHSMAAGDIERIEQLIKTCGLAETKAQRLKESAQQIIMLHGGRVPDTLEELEALAGVGHKTASVVINQAFGQPAFPVDTHIYRLARRWGLSHGNSVGRVEKDLKKIYEPEDWGLLHLRMILWGREFCVARGCKPSCEICEAVGSR